jgi:hypothetical protein
LQLVRYGRDILAEPITRQPIAQKKKPVTEVARLLRAHRATLYRALDGADH